MSEPRRLPSETAARVERLRDFATHTADNHLAHLASTEADRLEHEMLADERARWRT